MKHLGIWITKNCEYSRMYLLLQLLRFKKKKPSQGKYSNERNISWKIYFFSCYSKWQTVLDLKSFYCLNIVIIVITHEEATSISRAVQKNLWSAFFKWCAIITICVQRQVILYWQKTTKKIIFLSYCYENKTDRRECKTMIFKLFEYHPNYFWIIKYYWSCN